jgi:hypothetical protein
MTGRDWDRVKEWLRAKGGSVAVLDARDRAIFEAGMFFEKAEHRRKLVDKLQRYRDSVEHDAREGWVDDQLADLARREKRARERGEA